ncbi:pilus assembly protein PilV [Nitrincola sp. A-D6]|uniref:type IV pilus modification protein PilV n=1 Tax=Nitrincola sp. A-D6 TaxID=1545442 RepID=UPI00051FA928|nr:type IV pilus modification protein PilV [Nitrincola sp. A-D6]KGK42838.1 pilus assembly protein PilV [Nitrincola sp. A-D6]
MMNTFNSRYQKGVSLIEILIALVILSVGLLGMAGLQARTLSLNHSAYQRTQAVNLSYDMADRMRANRRAALDGDYQIALATANPTGNSVPDQDLREWRQIIQATLPSGNSSVAMNGDTVTIILQWDDSRGAEGLQSFEMVTEL